MPRPALIVRGRGLTGMTEETAPAACRPRLGRVSITQNRPRREAGSGHSPSPRRPTQTANEGNKQ